MRKLLKFILKILAKRAIGRYRPIVIGITGSVGKTTAKEATYAVLSRKFWVRKNEENYNNELGVPMAVLGIDPNKFKIFGYQLSAISRAFWLTCGWPRQKYPRMLILELAADRPGDIGYLVDVVKPQIGVVTAIGEVPVHVEFYASPQEVAKEKAKLVEQLAGKDGLAILNYDDQTVLDMKNKTKTKVMTFGLVSPASGIGPDVWVSDINYFVADGRDQAGNTQSAAIGGLSFKINFGGTFVPARIYNLIGIHQLYGMLAAVAVGLHFGMNLVDISGALENFELPRNRMNLIRGIKNSMIIDDTYNASPLSTHAALDALRDFARASRELGHGGRRIAVLGDMRELGKYEVEAHRSIGNLAAERCDILITVGAAAKFIADSAANQMSRENIISFNTSDEAKLKVQEIVRDGDVVLVKGSRSMKMERIVEEIKIL
ncbi:MAG: hypothetical protein HY452_02935 [Parcubacteria group bacterium]|nr:hypothetical protein [Parcubacteria group bacterium]